MGHANNKNDNTEVFIKFFTSVAVKRFSEIPHTDINFNYFLQYYNFNDTFFSPPLTHNKIREISF